MNQMLVAEHMQQWHIGTCAPSSSDITKPTVNYNKNHRVHKAYEIKNCFGCRCSGEFDGEIASGCFGYGS